jgi:hypothetical protein
MNSAVLKVIFENTAAYRRCCGVGWEERFDGDGVDMSLEPELVGDEEAREEVPKEVF